MGEQKKSTWSHGTDFHILLTHRAVQSRVVGRADEHGFSHGVREVSLEEEASVFQVLEGVGQAGDGLL